MHFEILIEDASGKIVLEHILEKILGSGGCHSYRIIAYSGIGHLPKNLNAAPDLKTRLLLNHLPAMLRAYGKSLPNDSNAVVVVVDLDDKDCLAFMQIISDIHILKTK